MSIFRERRERERARRTAQTGGEATEGQSEMQPVSAEQARDLAVRGLQLLEQSSATSGSARVSLHVEAIACFEAALQGLTERATPVVWAVTQVSLGDAYADLPTGDKEERLKQAIACYEAALRVRTEADAPHEWAGTQLNLGIAYADLPTEDRAANLNKAIACYEAALRVWTQADAPHEWALTQVSLGNAYADLPTGDKEERLKQAVECYQAALQIYTPDAFPFERLTTLSHLTALGVQQSDWPPCLTHCEDALTTLAAVRTAALTAPERRRLQAAGAFFFDRAALSAVRCQQITDALLFAERGKTRALLETLARRQSRPRHIEAADWQGYLERLKTLRNLEQQLTGASLLEREGVQRSTQLREEHARVRSQIGEQETRFRAADPNYQPTPPTLTWSDVRATLTQAEAVLVEFRVTEEGTLIFITDGSEERLTERNVVEVPDFTEETLRNLLVRYDAQGEPLDGWLMRYYTRSRSGQAHRAWLLCMEQSMAEVGQQLIAPVQARLQELYPHRDHEDGKTRLVLVANKELSLLPLHACPTQKDGADCLLESYTVFCAPGLALLRSCLSRPEGSNRLFAMPNPLNDLPVLKCTDWEVTAAAACFAEAEVLPSDLATQERVQTGLAGGGAALLSCHGEFNLSDVASSGLHLVDEERLPLDAVLEQDLSQLSLVALSACETAQTDFRDLADEAEGLHTAFLVAGATSSVGSLWAVDDLAAALLMVRFFRAWRTEGQEKAAALRSAALWLRGLSQKGAQQWLSEWEQSVSGGLLSAERKAAERALGTVREALLVRATGHLPDEPLFEHPQDWAAFQCHGRP